MKNKKSYIMVIAAVIVLGIIIAFLIILNHNKHYDIVDNGTFDLSDYQHDIDDFPSDENVSPIDSKEDVVSKSIALWKNELGTTGQKYDPLKGVKTIIVAFDSENECWLTYGKLPDNVKGARPTALIKQNGEVLAIWMG